MKIGAVTARIIKILQGINCDSKAVIKPETHLFDELGLSSIEVLELIEAINAEYSVDFLKPPLSVAALESPMAIAKVVTRVSKGKATSKA